MTNRLPIVCDGCGQWASPEHIARRLQRLEWTTRYRPLHIQTLFLGGSSPKEEKDFMYTPGGTFRGEAQLLLEATGVATESKTAEAVQTEFQRAGYFLTHVMECPIETEGQAGTELESLLAQHLSAMAARIRRSLKPKRVALISQALEPMLEQILALQMDCPVLLDERKPFALAGPEAARAAARLRNALAAAVPR